MLLIIARTSFCWQLKTTERETVQEVKPHPGKACTFPFLFWHFVVVFSVVVSNEQISVLKEYFLEISSNP